MGSQNYVPTMRSKRPIPSTGARVQNVFQKRRYVYSKALWGVNFAIKEKIMNVLCRTPTTIDLEPPKRSHCYNILIEEIDDPTARGVTGSLRQ